MNKIWAIFKNYVCDFFKEFRYLHELFQQDMEKTLSSLLQIHRFVFSDESNLWGGSDDTYSCARLPINEKNSFWNLFRAKDCLARKPFSPTMPLIMLFTGLLGFSTMTKSMRSWKVVGLLLCNSLALSSDRGMNESSAESSSLLP